MFDQTETNESVTQKITTVKSSSLSSPELLSIDTPLPPPLPYVEPGKVVTPSPSKVKKRDTEIAHIVQERCRQLCMSVFYSEHQPVRSLGFTSSIDGEGKSLLATVSAGALASDSGNPVVLLECNWKEPRLHKHFEIPSTPGLAEWLRGTCSESDIRYPVDRDLTIIPAGDGRRDAVKLLQQLRQKGLLGIVAHSNELLIVDLPAIVTTAYGQLAASLVESLVMVVRAGVTPDKLVAEACAQLEGLPVHGLLLNQVESHIPHWIKQML